MTPEESRQVRLAEFAVLRSEITTFLTLQIQFMSYSITLGGVIAGLSIKNPSFELVALFPLPFLIFGLLYLDAKGRILRVAKYIYTELRPTLIDSDDDGLGWESFIRKEHNLKPVLSVVDKLRWALFLVPSLVPIILAIIWLLGNGPQPKHGILVGFLFALELILFCFFIWIALKLEDYDKKLCEKEN